MWRLTVLKPRKKSRKYPITRDQFGRSGRRRAFDAFDRGLRPSVVAKEEHLKPNTVYRYFQQWKKLPPKLEMNYELAKVIRKRDHVLHEDMTNIVADLLDMSKEEVTERFQKPWELQRLIRGKWPEQSKQENSN